MNKSNPERTCIVTREKREQSGLIRIGFDRKTNVLKVGISEGRGVYLLPDLKTFDESVKKGKLIWGLKLRRALSDDEKKFLRDQFEIEVRRFDVSASSSNG